MLMRLILQRHRGCVGAPADELVGLGLRLNLRRAWTSKMRGLADLPRALNLSEVVDADLCAHELGLPHVLLQLDYWLRLRMVSFGDLGRGATRGRERP